MSAWAIVADVLQGAAAIVVAVCAVYGLTAWRREAKGRRRYELAEEALCVFYETEDAMNAVRSPLGYSSESEGRERQPDETPDEQHFLDNAYVVLRRLDAAKEPFGKLRALRYRFRAVFGPEAAKPFEEVMQARNKVVVSARMASRLCFHLRRRSTLEEREKLLNQLFENEDKFYWGADPDPIADQIRAAVEGMEATCGSVLGWRERRQGLQKRCWKWLLTRPGRHPATKPTTALGGKEDERPQ